MTAPRKRKARTVVDEGYSKLDEYAISLHEYYKSLRKAGFSVDNALWIVVTKESYPEWMQDPTLNDIRKHIEDEEDE
jgi:hypothetical protein